MNLTIALAATFCAATELTQTVAAGCISVADKAFTIHFCLLAMSIQKLGNLKLEQTHSEMLTDGSMKIQKRSYLLWYVFSFWLKVIDEVFPVSGLIDAVYDHQ